MLGIFLDTETNGLNYHKHRVIDIALKILDLTTGDERAYFNSLVFQPTEVWKKSDLQSLEINGFTYEEISKGKHEKNISDFIIQLLTRCKIQRNNSVFICQNPSFDRVFFSQIIDPDFQEEMKWPYHWLDLASMYWTVAMQKAQKDQGPFPWETGFTKDLIASNFELSQEVKPHRAINGVNHLILCYEAIIGFPYSPKKIPPKESLL